MTNSKVNLLGLSRKMLRDYLLSIGEKPFRGDQIMKWIYHAGASDFSEMTDVSKALRERLPEIAEIRAPEVIREQRSKDGTIKWALDVGDGQAVETVYIPEDDRATLCISTQVGCPMGCRFCSTGLQGFNRNLSAAEIVGQVWRAVSVLGFSRRTDERAISNVVMMGMGEPLLNLQNTVTTAEILLDDFGFGLSKRRVTVSTCGIVPAMDRLGDMIDVALAVSLPAPNDRIRSEIMPVNDRYPVTEIIDAARRFIGKSKANQGRVTIEYVLLDGINDSEDNARELARLLSNLPCKINLIPFNPHPDSEYRKPSERSVAAFLKVLMDKGYTAVVRKTRGDDIDAACGQLVGEVKNRLRVKVED